jgi:2-iminobutanoate/2-iminopropanoate deaminase
MNQFLFFVTGLTLGILSSCQNNGTSDSTGKTETKETMVDTPQCFLLRPKLEKEYGYSHAVKIGDDLKISGAVSMDDNGVIVAPGNMEQQMKNCYSDLEKILQHYGLYI